ncbi:uncharacterized protein LOC130014791 [Mercurialis annua]|uniref:uncharacterized protein LOC130014791 n=1 Tax=Mercurialis annua TaxID=3986 RepID=UPI0024ACC145|nr:uncharacterized protein LOC130014791 [Mercurialis annua]
MSFVHRVYPPRVAGPSGVSHTSIVSATNSTGIPSTVVTTLSAENLQGSCKKLDKGKSIAVHPSQLPPRLVHLLSPALQVKYATINRETELTSTQQAEILEDYIERQLSGTLPSVHMDLEKRHSEILTLISEVQCNTISASPTTPHMVNVLDTSHPISTMVTVPIVAATVTKPKRRTSKNLKQHAPRSTGTTSGRFGIASSESKRKTIPGCDIEDMDGKVCKARKDNLEGLCCTNREDICVPLADVGRLQFTQEEEETAAAFLRVSGSSPNWTPYVP